MTTSTLLSLNSNSQTTLSFTDNRPSNVLFDFLTARDVNETITAQTFTLKRRIDITEIIKPSESLPQFIVDVSGVTGATVNFGTLPAGVTVTDNGAGLFTINGITTISDWQAVRAPTITVPATFFGTTTVDCTIRWYNSLDAAFKTLTWTHGNYIPVTLMSSVSSISCDGDYLAGANAQLDGVFTVRAITPVENILPSIFSIEAINTKIITPGTVTLDSAFGIDLYSHVRNLKNITFLSNQANSIFASPTTPEIVTNPSSSISLTLTVSSGAIGENPSNVLTNSLTLTGTTKSDITTKFNNIRFYPDYNDTNNVELTWAQTDDGTPLDSITTLMTFAGAGSLTTSFANVLQDTTYTLPYDAFEYGRVDLLLVGGGGGGTDLGGGGGGGSVKEVANFSIPATQPTYSLLIGTGGTASPNWNISGDDVLGGNGGTTSGFGSTVGGGNGGRSFWLDSGGTIGWNGQGGSSGTPGSNSGGADQNTTTSSKARQSVGGGGGGAGAQGTYISSGGTNGGAGVVSTVFGGTYGGGGIGGYAIFTGDSDGGAGGGGSANSSGTDYLGGGGGASHNNLQGAGGKGVIKIKISPK